MDCGHERGDWIAEKAFWLCADCWARLPEAKEARGLKRVSSYVIVLL